MPGCRRRAGRRPCPAGGGWRRDAHRLKELEGLIDSLPGVIAKHDATLADPGLYSRDPKAFDAAMKAADKARADLENAEMEWLELEEKKAALAG